MEIIQVSIIALSTVILATSIKGLRPEIAILLSISACITIVVFLTGYLAEIIDLLKEIANDINLDISFAGIILKIIAVAYICEFSASVCRDSGETAIASKVELAGKILILYLSTPIILAFLKTLTDIV